MKIREQDPLKQGLKPKKARIQELMRDDSRARSIKTRIETSVHVQRTDYQAPIREQDPLKQGLKLKPS